MSNNGFVKTADQGFICLDSGGSFSPFHLKESDIEIYDIAAGLSKKCRWSGQCSPFYSVAQHSMLAALQLWDNPQHSFDALMHDASEAYLPDLPSPIKQKFPEFRKMEDDIDKEIAIRFGVTYPLPPEVKHVDMRLQATERRDLMTPFNDESIWGVKEQPYKEFVITAIQDMTELEQGFLLLYYELLDRLGRLTIHIPKQPCMT